MPFADRQGALMPTFQSFWSGKVLSPYEVMCLRSFIDRGQDFDLYTFERNLEVPRGVRLRDAAQILGPEEFFVYEEGIGKGSPAAFANLFRYRLLAERGGWWVDTDVLCLTGAVPDFTEFFAREDDRVINIAVLYFEPRHPLMLACFEEAKRMGRNVRWGDAGPYLFTRLAKELGYEDRALAPNLCYPIHHSRAIDILRPSRLAYLTKLTEKSPFAHLYNASLRLKHVEKEKAPPPGSILDFWARRHAIDGWRGCYDEATVEHLLSTTERPRPLR
jgi:hypothetical protein